MRLTNEQRTELKKRLRAAMKAMGDDASAVSMASKDALLGLANAYSVAIPTIQEVTNMAPTSAQQVFTPVNQPAATVAPVPSSIEQDEPDQQDAAPAASSRVQTVLAPLGAGDFEAFRRALEDLARDADKPAQIVTQTVTLGAPGSTPAHIPTKTGTKTAADLFGLSGAHGKMSLAMWDAPDAPAIDPHYVWHPDTPAVLTQMRRGRNVMFTGPAGTGKTSWPQQFAARTGRPFVRISCNDQTDAAQLVGMTVPKAGATEWKDGILTAAIRRPGTVIMIDEPSAARPGALMVLQAVLDAERTLSIDETGERVPVADGVLFVLGDNTAGSGDETGAYEGTRRMNRATLDRCGITVQFGYLAPDLEKHVLVSKTGCKPAIAAALVSYANATRQDASAGRMTHGVGIRRLMSWAELITDGIDVSRAFDLTVWTTAAPDDRETLRQLFATHINVTDLTKLARS